MVSYLLLRNQQNSSGIFVVPKPNGTVRICVDLTQLNKAVRREIHPMASVDESLAKLANSKIFTKLDAKSGFWQIPLVEESKKYTTFITPFGRYQFNRLPFGISSASEVFQRTISAILGDMDGIICHMDDILIHASDAETHNKQVRIVMQKLQKAGLTLNEKCEFSKDSIKFLGHIIDGNGIHIDPEKVTAINNFPQPNNVTELQRLMGMLNQLAKFTPNLASITEPLRALLKKTTQWTWGHHQEEAFQQIKLLLISPPVLAHYSPDRKTIIAADASHSGIGAVLYQIQEDSNRRPICYISRSLSDTEQRYAVIEKEALAVTWACERLSEYILGLKTTIETDHKPLVPLLGSMELYKLPPRIQRFRLRLMRYNVNMIHVSGKNQITADALSRAPVSQPNQEDLNFLEETKAYAQMYSATHPASYDRLQQFKEAQKADTETVQVRIYCQNGWPDFMPENSLLKQYWINRQHFTIIDDLLLYDTRIVIPRALRLDVLNKLHEGHMGITKTRALATSSVWWPYLSSQIEEMVQKCFTCSKHRVDHKEPLLPSSLPGRPWSRLGIDFFEFQGKTFIVVVDYYSRWIELRALNSMTSANTILHLKSIFSVHGIPDVVVSDNGPQFASHEFQTFAKEYGFTHTTSSPRYPQSNGEAERAVQTVKNLLKKAKDPYAAILLYRATPLQNGFSPAELLMSRKLQTKVPIVPSSLTPATPHFPTVQSRESTQKEAQRQYFNQHNRAKTMPILHPGTPVYIKDLSRHGVVTAQHHNPRSYIIQTDQGQLRRNRSHLIETPTAVTSDDSIKHTPAKIKSTPNSVNDNETPTLRNTTSDGKNTPPHDNMTPTPSTTRITTRYGRPIKNPQRLDL